MNEIDAHIMQKVAQKSADCEDRIVALENELIITRLALDNAVNEINRLRKAVGIRIND